MAELAEGEYESRDEAVALLDGLETLGVPDEYVLARFKT